MSSSDREAIRCACLGVAGNTVHACWVVGAPVNQSGRGDQAPGLETRDFDANHRWVAARHRRSHGGGGWPACEAPRGSIGAPMGGVQGRRLHRV